jgi:hypothetical protein
MEPSIPRRDQRGAVRDKKNKTNHSQKLNVLAPFSDHEEKFDHLPRQARDKQIQKKLKRTRRSFLVFRSFFAGI